MYEISDLNSRFCHIFPLPIVFTFPRNLLKLECICIFTPKERLNIVNLKTYPKILTFERFNLTLSLNPCGWIKLLGAKNNPCTVLDLLKTFNHGGLNLTQTNSNSRCGSKK